MIQLIMIQNNDIRQSLFALFLFYKITTRRRFNLVSPKIVITELCDYCNKSNMHYQAYAIKSLMNEKSNRHYEKYNKKN